MSTQGLLLLFSTMPNKWSFLMKRINPGNLVATEALIGEIKFRGDTKPELPNTRDTYVVAAHRRDGIVAPGAFSLDWP